MASPEGNSSPISQLLTTLGLTREDLQQRSDEMRQFLTAENDQSSRVTSRGRASSSSSAHIHSLSRSNSIISTTARSLSRASSSSFRDASPPVTPVKSEPSETGLPTRQYDSMEVIIERQRQARKEKKQKKDKDKESHSRRSMSHASPTPSNASSRSIGFDSFLQRRDDEQVDVKGPLVTALGASVEARSPPPLTPQQSKYYREHTVSQSKTVVPKTESTPTPVAQLLLPPPPPPTQQPTPHYPISEAALLSSLQALQASTSAPVTPHIRRLQTLNGKAEKSPLPPSSPFAMSPQSSPAHGVVNLVSSPGPMGPPPEEDSYGKLPYTLPSGPYSPNKPDLSYAALLGQAILSSSEHRLTLQEIYDWITIVYPFFKRGETTWMNSIRHVLSTTACFRKVTRDRALGRTQWAIWAEDLECFKGGGFRKQFCKDMNGGKHASEVTAKTKRGRKHVEDNDGSADRKTKKSKKDNKEPESSYQRPIVPAASIFPSTRPAPPLQPYREASVASNMAPEIVFPPLPAESGFRQLSVNPTAATSVSTSRAASQLEGDDTVPDSSPTSSALDSHPPSSASTSSMPELTPNCSSSSPPPSSNEMELDAPIQILDGCLAPSVTVSGLDSDDEATHDAFSSTKLTPVQFWGASDTSRLQRLGGKLNFSIPTLDSDQESDDDGPLLSAVKNKNKKTKLAEPFERLPPSPTRKTKGRSKARTRGSRSTRQSTPPPNNPPSTPPPNRRLQLSPVHTPLSHKGLHMSPSASLAHYKSHLDPPPTMAYDQASGSGATDDEYNSFLHSPVRRASASGLGGTPITPKKLAFPLLDDSPFRTTFGGLSPFRTPGSRSMFDPHDPRAILDEEFGRLGSTGMSPASGGLFGKDSLYDSPGGLPGSSPGKYKRWW